jgi:hypothetical protein
MNEWDPRHFSFQRTYPQGLDLSRSHPVRTVLGAFALIAAAFAIGLIAAYLRG